MKEALAGLFSGLAGGMGDIMQTRRQNAQLELQKRQTEAQLRQQRLAEVTAMLDSAPAGTSMDPSLVSEAKGFGLMHRFGRGADGMPVLLESPKQKLDRIKLEDAEVDAKVSQLQLSESEASKAFRERLSTDEGIQWAMSQPKEKRQLLFARHGMQAPLTTEEIAAEDLAKASGQLRNTQLQGANQMAVQGLQNQGYIETARINSGTRSPISQTDFQNWISGMYSRDPQFRQEFDAAKAAADGGQDPTAMSRFHALSLEEYKRQRSSMPGGMQ